MESLLDNPMKAVLYLKELTTIVQNQQSLIQTQRQRIDELERKVEDLIGENRRLRDPHPHPQHPQPQPQQQQQHQHHQHHQHQHHHHQHHHHPPAHPPPHPQRAAPSKAGGASAQVAAAAAASAPPPPPPQQLQLVPATTPPPVLPSPSQPSPDTEDDERRSPRCKSLLPQTPTSLCRSVGLARKAENQTVLHQFCCPAPDAPEAESQACVPSEETPPASPVTSPSPCGAPEGPERPPDGGSPATPVDGGGGGGGGGDGGGAEGSEATEAETRVGESEIEDRTPDQAQQAQPQVQVQHQPHQQQQQQQQQEEEEEEEVEEEVETEEDVKKEAEDEEAGGGRGGTGGGRRPSLHHTASPIRVQRNGACSHSTASDYELSLDLKNKQIEMLEHKYGGHLISRRAACKIQTAFRQYQLSKNFEKIRNSLLESRLPHRISLRKVRVQNAEGFSAERALAEGCSMAGIPLVRSPSLPTTVGGTLTDLEDSFTEQVQSLAKSIDDALSNWSLKTMCSLQEGGTYQFSSEAFSAAGAKPAMAGTIVEGGPIDPNVLQSGMGQGDNSENVARSASKLMMAFRDVTVQIDSQNFRMSSSVMESSTSVSLGNCIQQGAAVTECAKLSPVEEATPQEQFAQPPQEPAPPPPELDLGEVPDGDFPAPPPSEEEFQEELPPLALEKTEIPGPEVPPPAEAVLEAVLPPEVLGTPVAPNVEVLEAKRSESDPADNSSEQMSSSSTSTSARSASEASSKEALQTMMLSLPRYHCENPASCKSPTLSTDVMRKRLYRIGLNLFNVNPDKGLQFLISRGFIPDTPIGVAHFLLQRKGLSRQMIGEFLGNSKKPFNREVLDCVVDEMDFSGMELDEALRKFQAHIRVQGEAQKVERLIEAFSQRYCMCNPDVVQQFHNPDTIFILAFAIILLNTDMYSPNIKPDRKMMLEDFIRNLRGVDDGADIPRDMVVGIYERIQLRELRSNEDHVTYVTKVEQSIVGMKTVLSVPHRRLVCCSRLFEVTDINKAQKQAAHQREVFLFNDLIVILKLCPKKKSSAAYTFCKAMGLLGMGFHLFENEYYPHAITIVSPISGSDKKQVLNFCTQSSEELLKFVEDLKESIAEVTEMEQIRIEWELEKQQGSKTHSSKNNGTQLELRGRQSSPSGKRDIEAVASGHNAVEVSIHNRLQTYQLSAAAAAAAAAAVQPRSPESVALLNHRGELYQQPQPPQPQHQPPLQCVSPTPSHSHQPVAALSDLRPDTLIQCQQIVKVIVLDKGGHGRVEAFLSQSPAHHHQHHHHHHHHQQIIQSVVSTPVRSPDGGGSQREKDGSQPPLPPPPPPYNHPHQYIPPDPRLSLQRTPSGSRSIV
ncbi:IQ motif and SEC7 domain-containing protein 3 isoform X2 [Astyanax mexicanus]|uniref:IQ motif and SEC7 domain-containing protein 3 isoform X2 n=1 Tax=Astyanax mexicanus TaxID=7994 RepID=UPI0020CACD47|nr:IQ motif and SEC7 domain-containing protein 3 isoform X2 [Astyanax mexicanus]